MRKFLALCMVLILLMCASACTEDKTNESKNGTANQNRPYNPGTTTTTAFTEEGGEDHMTLEEQLVGKWYNNIDKLLDIREDGTYDLESDYGTGTWKVLEDNETVEFKDFYGSTHQTKLTTNLLGEYLNLGNFGRFYKNSCPSFDSLEVDTEEVFEGVALEVTGVTPFCEIKVDTSNAGELAKDYMKFRVSKEKYYTVGDSVTVTASFNDYTAKKTFTKDFIVESDLAYVNDVSELNVDQLNKEIYDCLEENRLIHNEGEDNTSVFFNIHDKWQLGEPVLYEYGFVKCTDAKYEEMVKYETKRDYNAYYAIHLFRVTNTEDNTTANMLVETFLFDISKNSNGEYVWGADTNKGIARKGMNIKYHDSKTSFGLGWYASYFNSYDYTLNRVWFDQSVDVDSIFG